MQAVQMAADGEELTPQKEEEHIERKWRRMTPEARARFNERWRQLHDPEFQRRKDERAHWRREFQQGAARDVGRHLAPHPRLHRVPATDLGAGQRVDLTARGASSHLEARYGSALEAADRSTTQ